MANRLDENNFRSLLKALNVPAKLDWAFLYQAYCDAKTSSEGFAEQNNILARMAVNDVTLTLYLVNEHYFYLLSHPEQKEADLVHDEGYEQLLLSISLDKYYTNEHLAYRNAAFSNRFQPEISTISLYLNFVLGMLSRYHQGEPHVTLIVDILQKGFSMAQCIVALLTGGFETEAFSTWRTLHENECILLTLVRYGQPVIQEYLKHLRYAVAFRGGLSTKEETDKVFEDIKGEMRAHDLKSKDMKRFIEYGWLYGIPDVEKIEGFKLNFRDGVERAANLREYAKIYEMSSEIAHSSPLLIYSRKDYFYQVTVLNLYESFFRLEKVFSSLYLSTVSAEEQASYRRMQGLYRGELFACFSLAKRRFSERNEQAPKKEAVEAKENPTDSKD
ncbi:MAG: DUF5677 domain-containing protein [Erysipelotrichaceae bacterium]|nr:DUF5677 domain-containing protein [Erysipelotrichaceae bacterium]